MHRCAVGAKESRAHEIVVISWALRWCVLGGVLLSRTLAGAVPSALSGLASGFGMDTGRFPVAVTTETAVGSAVWCRLLRYEVVWCGRPPSFAAAHPGVGVVWLRGWVGCGPYSGRFALSCCLPPVTLCSLPAAVRRVGGCGGCCLCRPISTSQLEAVTGLPLLAYQPSSLLGAYQDTEVSCGDLILKMVSRLDAFSGYPSRT